MKGKAVDKVLDSIITKIEEGKVLPWNKPWSNDNTSLFNLNVITKHVYTGINQIACWSADFSSPYWITFPELKKRGIYVKKGEKATSIIAMIPYKKKVKSDDKEDDVKKGVYFKYISIFNVEQLQEGYEDKIPELASFDKDNTATPIQKAEKLLSKYYIKVNHTGNSAFYKSSTDTITIPKFASFKNPEEYHSTKFHEYVHSTGHKERLNRTTLVDASFFGSKKYCEEELVAEIGAATLCAEAGITNIIDNSVSYVNGWLKKIKEDKQVLLRAASAASKAVEFILKGKK